MLSGLIPTPITMDQVFRTKYEPSRTVEVQDKFGQLFVVKLGRDPLNTNALANEVLGAELMMHLRIPVPRWTAIELSKQDLSKIARYQPLRFKPVSGLHFASEHLDHPDYFLTDLRIGLLSELEIMFDTQMNLFLLDVLLNRQGAGRQFIRRTHGRAVYRQLFFIDNTDICHGLWSESKAFLSNTAPAFSIMDRTQSLQIDHIQPYVAPFQAIVRRVILTTLRYLPPEWHSGDKTFLEDSLMDRLSGLSSLVEPHFSVAKALLSKHQAILDTPKLDTTRARPIRRTPVSTKTSAPYRHDWNNSIEARWPSLNRKSFSASEDNNPNQAQQL